MDSDVLNVVVAVFVIFGLVRWWSKPAGPGSNDAQRPSLSFHPKNVTPSMITSVQNAFPQEPRANVHYDLLRTGNVQVTCNTLIEKGSLPPPPPAFFQLYPQPDLPAPTTGSQIPSSIGSSTAVSTSSVPTNLIQRFNLEKEISSNSTVIDGVESDNGKAAWLDTAQKRQESLQQRKAQMVLAARQKMLEKQAKAKGKGKEVES